MLYYLILAALSSASLIIRQIRIGFRDRGDRRGLIENPYIASHLVELRRIQSPSGIVKRRRPSNTGGHPAPPLQLTPGDPPGEDTS